MRVDRQDAKTPRLREPTAALDEIAREVVDAALEVHRTLGPGFSELVYQNALGIELALRGVPFTRQARVLVAYKGACVGEGRLDILVAYLKATHREIGLLINFDVAVLKSGVKRVILTQ